MQLPTRGPLTCCMLPRIFCPSRWISLVTTWGYLLLMELRAPSGSLASSESRTAWTVVARFMWVRASTCTIHKTGNILQIVVPKMCFPERSVFRLSFNFFFFFLKVSNHSPHQLDLHAHTLQPAPFSHHPLQWQSAVGHWGRWRCCLTCPPAYKQKMTNIKPHTLAWFNLFSYDFFFFHIFILIYIYNLYNFTI